MVAKENFCSYANVGNELMKWGWYGGLTPAEIKKLTTQEKILCVLVAMHRDYFWERISKRTKMRTPVSDGAFLFLAFHAGCTPIPPPTDKRRSELSARARRVLSECGFRLFSELSPESLANIKNCGEATVSELMEFKREFVKDGSRCTSD